MNIFLSGDNVEAEARGWIVELFKLAGESTQKLHDVTNIAHWEMTPETAHWILHLLKYPDILSPKDLINSPVCLPLFGMPIKLDKDLAEGEIIIEVPLTPAPGVYRLYSHWHYPRKGVRPSLSSSCL